MEIKKNTQADLEKKKNVFLQVGLVIVLALTLFAFEWTVSEATVDNLENTQVVQLEQEMEVDVTQQEEEEVKPPPAAAVIEEIQVVEDDVEIEDQMEIDDIDMNEDTEIEIKDIQQEEENEEVFQFAVIEDKPEFPGGDAALIEFLGKSTKYPEMAVEANIKGTVYVGFVIGKDGSVGDVKVLRPVDPLLDAEAIRVVRSMPKWKPGKQRGKAVKVSYQVPIKFILAG